MTHVDLNDPASRAHYILPLDRENTRTVDRTGGTFLHTSRTNPQKMKKLPPVCAGGDFPLVESTKKGVTSQVYDITAQVLKNIATLGLDYLVAIGGDDTLSYAARLDKEGVKVIAVPKTMDNDVRNTEYCIGFSTAITRAMDAIDRQRTTVGSHERIGVVRRRLEHHTLFDHYLPILHQTAEVITLMNHDERPKRLDRFSRLQFPIQLEMHGHGGVLVVRHGYGKRDELGAHLQVTHGDTHISPPDVHDGRPFP